MRRFITGVILTMLAFAANAQQVFFNLTAEEVRIDSVLPYFSYRQMLGANYNDSVYAVEIDYPEFIDMMPGDIEKYQLISDEVPGMLPEMDTHVAVERKKGVLETGFTPIVYRDGKYKKLVSFMLRITATPKQKMHKAQSSKFQVPSSKFQVPSSERYTATSVLATGNWAKIRVSQSGIHQLTDAVIKRAGFSSLDKVKIYGYGGALQNEKLVGEELVALDDLKEVPTCTVDGRRLFYAQGPVSWNSSDVRVRNPYSDYGYYFITQSDEAPLSVSAEEFLAANYPKADDYNALHEIDNYAWFRGGRNLFENTPINLGSDKTYTIARKGASDTGKMKVVLSAGSNSTAEVSVNDSVIGTFTITLGTYDAGNSAEKTFVVYGLKDENSVKITPKSGGPIRLDYISLHTDQPAPAPALSSASFPQAEYVYNITNQNHHADRNIDMVIIVPTSGILHTQAQRLKTFHEQHDSMTVKVVPADELYNEFSSGTPDANAYRRYMKMLYDRAETEAEMPRYLLLFGDCVWDNRMNISDMSTYSLDDFLLCYESENSFSHTYCYIDDGFFCLLDDGEGADILGSDKHDIAVGRISARNEEEAKIMVDKTINYINNENAGSWQNVVMFMGDDGNNNIHMEDSEAAAQQTEAQQPGMVVRRVMWDAYQRQTSSTGATYPGATADILQQQNRGALVMDYCGHGGAYQLSHEGVVRISDFESATNAGLPLWITASCNVAPFDGVEDNIGEVSIFNRKGGAIAFYGTTRTVFVNRNREINLAFLKYALGYTDGKPNTLGEAQRLAKNELITSGKDRSANKLQYSLLGDPALALKLPTQKAVIDKINGTDITSGTMPMLKAGSIVKVEGHIEKQGAENTEFNGQVTATVRDSKALVTCKQQEPTAEKAFTFYDRTKTLFNGSDSVRNGKFSFSFAVPMDISYTNGQGMINVYAINNAKTEAANGFTEQFTLGGTESAGNDSIGPSIYCYLNSPSFANGGNVNATPYFVAQITDKDGINTTGNGIGHDLELVIDGDMSKTYILNDNFEYDFGSYTSGTTHYAIPELSAGQHKLRFRAWDILNNSSTAELTFNVVRGLEPTLYSVSCTENPASTTTTFIVNHDYTGSNLDVDIDIFDISGRHLWTYSDTGVATTGTYTTDWNLTIDGGERLQTGVYLYRVRISADGSSKVSKAKKLIIIQ
ncbi:MAG: type IX secretion system sortase PorU [Prevotella sp.]|nr:type IX secretion system sortase PorU [Prevotella sp.]